MKTTLPIRGSIERNICSYIRNNQSYDPDNCVKQHPMHVNPIQEYRKHTDLAFIALFTIIFIAWISVTIQALIYPLIAEYRSEEVIVNYKREHRLFDVERIELRFSWKFFLCTFLSGMVAIVYMFLLFQPIIGHVIVYIALLIVFASIILYFAGSFLLFLVFRYPMISAFSAFLLLFLAYQVVVFYCFAKIRLKAVFAIVGDACRAILFYPTSLLFVCLMSVLIVALFSLSLFVLKRIPSYYPQYSHVVTYCAIEIFGVGVVIAFIVNFTQMVVSGFVIDWFWTKDQNLVSRGFIRKHIDRTLSYHMGTVCFGSIPLLPNVCAIVQACCCVSDTGQVAIKGNIFIRFISQISLIINVRDFALIQTSIYGSNYVTSIMAAIDLVSQNPKLNLAVTETSNALVMMGVVLAILPFEIEELYFAIYSIPVPVFIILVTVFRALLVNKMIMQNTTEALKGLTVSVHDSSTATMYYV